MTIGNRNDAPEQGTVYALTGGSDTPCIANGNTWEESVVAPVTEGSDIFCPTCGEPWDLCTKDGRSIRCGANTCSACKAHGYDVEVTS